jgi:ubiquinone/menaquinone biosynthesis C-methylase UbiE
MKDSREHATRNAIKFDAWAATYEDRRFDFFRLMQKRVLGLLEPGKNSAVLDIGCGTGWAVRAAAEMVGPGGAACGIDLSSKMIQQAMQAAQGIKNIHLRKANAEELPFEHDSFDFIMCTMSFHHYLNPGKAAREMARVLKPGGTVCIVDPTADFFLIRWVDECIKRRQPEHVGFYSTEEFSQFFEAAGLSYLESKRVVLLWFTAKAHFAAKKELR